MIIEALRDILKVRLNLHANDDYATEECWKKETTILSEDVNATISFFERECTDEEFYWLSEVFSIVSEKMQSKELVQAMRARLARVRRETYDQSSFKSEHMRKWVDYDEYIRSVSMEIDYAEGALKEE